VTGEQVGVAEGRTELPVEGRPVPGGRMGLPLV
jgi:hypothetical protein